MSTFKVNYSELVEALKSHRNEEANRLLEELMPRLQHYLKVTRGANNEDAKDAVQIALMMTYERIMEDEITDEKYIYKYLLIACRNSYGKLLRGTEYLDDSAAEDYPELMAEPEQQIRNLLDKERQNILEICMNKLTDEERKFITFIINNPHARSEGVGDKFGLTKSNVRVKKSRIINDLSHCVNKKYKSFLD